MKQFDELIEIADRLLGPNGCPWDRKQTFKTIRSTLLEEACEVIEAIDDEEPHKLQEELGDLLFNFVFLCKLAEKETLFKTEDAIQEIVDKLIRRHPHVFGEVEINDHEQVMKQWEEIKQTEKNNHHRKSLLDGIPKNLPALAKAYKTIHKVAKTNYLQPEIQVEWNDEETLGKHLLSLVKEAHEKGLDPELALRKTVAKYDEEFREWESN